MKRAFTLIETLIVVALVCSLLAFLTASYRRAKSVAKVTQQAVSLKHHYDNALIDGKIKARDYDYYQRQFQRQLKSGLEQTK